MSYQVAERPQPEAGPTGPALPGKGRSRQLPALFLPAFLYPRGERASGNGGRIPSKPARACGSAAFEKSYWGKKHGISHSMGATRLGGLSSWNSTRQGRVSVSAESL